MKNLTLLLLLSTFFCFAQKQEKETVYLLFDNMNEDKCNVEDGSGNSEKLNKYRKLNDTKISYLIICNEYFAYDYKKSKVDTCSINILANLKIVDLAYIEKKKSENVMRYNPFKKIYIIEKISDTKVIKYDVTWIGDWNMIRD
ncbi:hypothetical protein [Kordia jejudonensis]|uniref:hypothetical protein n=1 Tax=Kordia jejudonensis TaxID=1348245 RepID=UPI000629A8ED|nr:hypothetical protein [Kordia jejudonensis]